MYWNCKLISSFDALIIRSGYKSWFSTKLPFIIAMAMLDLSIVILLVKNSISDLKAWSINGKTNNELKLLKCSHELICSYI